MKTQIGNVNADTKTVAVTYEFDNFEHKRDVPMCLNAAGEYDDAATAIRINDIGLGVQRKYDVGAISAYVSPVYTEPKDNNESA